MQRQRRGKGKNVIFQSTYFRQLVNYQSMKIQLLFLMLDIVTPRRGFVINHFKITISIPA